MIITVTPNPSLDRTLHITSFRRGAVHRALDESVEPSGKGVNVSLALHRAGIGTTAVLPVGGIPGLQLTSMLDAAGLPHRDVPIAGSVRSNTSLIEADGTTTKVNEAGPRLTDQEVDALLQAADAATARGGWTAWCGSLPRGFDAERLAQAVARGRAAGGLIAVDSSGEALATAIAQPPDRVPHLVKPNADELAELTGRPLSTIGDVADAAATLVGRGVRTVLVSLGPDGAALVERELFLHGVAPVPRVVNTVGAGDAFLAGYLSAGRAARSVGEPADARYALTRALRYAAAAVQHEGTLVSGPDETVPVVVDTCDRSRPLHEPASPPAQASATMPLPPHRHDKETRA